MASFQAMNAAQHLRPCPKSQQPTALLQTARPLLVARKPFSSAPQQRSQLLQVRQQRRRRCHGLCRAEQQPVNPDASFEDKEYDRLADSIREMAGEVKEGLGGTSIYLVGMMGSGKSTVGKLLSAALGYYFFDSDAVVEDYTKQTVQEIFEAEGEEAFREVETAVLQELAPFKQAVVATGGGVVTRRVNWGHMTHAVTVWLDGPPKLLATRVLADGTDSRPLVAAGEGEQGNDFASTVQKLEKLLGERRGQYQAADIKIQLAQSNGDPNLGATAAVIVHRILTTLKKRLAEKSAEVEEKRNFTVEGADSLRPSSEKNGSGSTLDSSSDIDKENSGGNSSRGKGFGTKK